ncbi:MAG TPA: DUF1684 domain-containing protein [Anaerolineales bacterium]|nr:DUF1684 domain-containing protein [Anaerolineales bacterium]
MASNNEIESAVLKWRAERAEFLRTQQKSWLCLAALYWPKTGPNTFGSHPACDFVLPAGAPQQAGVFHFKNDALSIEPAPGVEMTCNGGPLPLGPLGDDQQEEPDFISLGRFTMVVLRRGSATLVRLWDAESPDQKAFSGLNFYPYKPEYRIQAKYFGYAPCKFVKQSDIIGEIVETKMLGYLIFKMNGKDCRLDVEDAGDGSFFIAFRDETNSKTTYAGGRYLVTEKLDGNLVTIDFNRAFNPPCAYTTFATCVLPPSENILHFPLEAGEKKYKDDH